jgi:hypothetical protein
MKRSSSSSTSLEKEHKSVDLVKKTAVGGGIAVKIERAPWETAKMFGRQSVIFPTFSS